MIRSFFGIYHPLHKLTLLSADLACIALSFYLASNFRLNLTPEFLSLEYIGLNIIIVFSLFAGGAYTSSVLSARPRLPLNTFFVVLASALPCSLFIYLLGPERFNTLLGRGVFPAAIIALSILSVVARLLINSLLRTPQNPQHILFLGEPQFNEKISGALNDSPIPIRVKYAERLTEDGLLRPSPKFIVICPEHDPDHDEQQLLVNLRLSGTPIFSLADFFESFLLLVPIEYVDNNWFIKTEGFTMLSSSVMTRIKTFLDILAASTLLIVTSPIVLLAMLAIKLSSRGPALFSQTRVGIHGNTFTLYKLRTMSVDAEAHGPQWAAANDPRIFPIGRFLRKSRIDEIPQCWNILRGEMSFIGPRPERPEFTSMLAEDIPYYDLRHIVKPGLTGWAQVMHPYGASKEDALRKLQYDLYYIKNYSLLLDLNIILRTILITLHRGGR